MDFTLLHDSRESPSLHDSRDSPNLQKPSRLPKLIAAALGTAGCVWLFAISDPLTSAKLGMNKGASSSPIDLSGSDVGACFPLDGSTVKMFVNGSDNGVLNRWLSFNSDGGYVIANYGEGAAMPIRLDKIDGSANRSDCHTYHFANTYLAVHDKSSEPDTWVGTTDCGLWLKNYESPSEAQPIKLVDGGDGTYKLQPANINGGNQYLGYINGSVDNCGDHHPAHTVRANYPEADAMKVTLHELPAGGYGGWIAFYLVIGVCIAITKYDGPDLQLPKDDDNPCKGNSDGSNQAGCIGQAGDCMFCLGGCVATCNTAESIKARCIFCAVILFWPIACARPSGILSTKTVESAGLIS